MRSSKIIILIIILFGIAAIFYFWGYPIYKEKFKEQKIIQENVQIQAQKEEKEIPKTREELANYLEKNIDYFTPYKPMAERWIVKRLGFVDEENIYLELEDGHNLLKILLSCKEQKEEFKCYNIARFEPENFVWKITEGNDSFADDEVFYYEKKGGKWVMIGSSFEIIYFPISFDSLLKIQMTVDQGYLLWRKEPLSVLRHNIPAKFDFDINRDLFKPIERDEKEGKIIYQITFNNKEVWNVILLQPIKKGERGVWVVESMHKVK